MDTPAPSTLRDIVSTGTHAAVVTSMLPSGRSLALYSEGSKWYSTRASRAAEGWSSRSDTVTFSAAAASVKACGHVSKRDAGGE